MFFLTRNLRGRISSIVFLTILLFTMNENQAQKACNLEYCIKKGLERNFALQVVRNQEEIASNNHTLGNAGMWPSVSLQNKYGGLLNDYHQNMGEENEQILKGIHNNSGLAGINLEMTIFRGLQVKQTYEKLGVQNELESLNTQISVENLVVQIVTEYNNYIQQLIHFYNFLKPCRL